MADTAPLTEVEFDHHSPEFAANRFEVCADLRAHGVSYSPAHGGFYVLSRYDDVQKAALDHKAYTNGRDRSDPVKLGVTVPPSEFGLMIPEEADPPDHTAYRRAMAPYFTVKAAEAMEHRLLHWTTVCIDEVIETGRMDFVTDLTSPVSFLFFCEMLGLDVAEWRRWYDPIHIMQTNVPGSPAAKQALADEVHNQHALQDIVRERRENPRDDLITRLAEAERPDGERFSAEEVAALARIVLFGAVDSVVSLIAQAGVFLDEHPEERQRLIDEPELIPTAVEEFLRYFTPGTSTMRTVQYHPAEIAGQPLKPGDRVMLNWLAANHDPEAFPEADKLIMDRAPNRHLAFGAGIHKCIGLHFGRVEARILLAQLLQRIPDYRVLRDELVPIKAIGLFSGYWNVPTAFTPGPRLQADRRPDAQRSAPTR